MDRYGSCILEIVGVLEKLKLTQEFVLTSMKGFFFKYFGMVLDSRFLPNNAYADR